MKILFTGDVNFRGLDTLTIEKSREILAEVYPFLETVDYRIPNLETPLADKEKHDPIKKSGPNLICSPENIVFLKAFQADAVTLANNHIGDYGEGATKDTLKLLDENEILHAGAGANIEEAYKALYLEKADVCVAIISVCENEFGIATKSNYGSAGYEPRLLMKQIKKEKQNADFVIVVFHGGNEFNPLPSPDTRERYRLICDMGADAVIGGHTHCPQGYEYYGKKPIVYSMGNFLFQKAYKIEPNDSWYYGYMSILDIEDGINLQIIPYKFNQNATKITVFEGDDRKKMMEYIEKLSDIILDEEELGRYFQGWAWYHRWLPGPPKDYEDTDGYNVCGNLNLTLCESHHSQCKAVLETLFRSENMIAKMYEDKIRILQKMPI